MASGNKKEILKLKQYLLYSHLFSSKTVVLRVSDFPILGKYAEQVQSYNRSTYFGRNDKLRGEEVVSFDEIYRKEDWKALNFYGFFFLVNPSSFWFEEDKYEKSPYKRASIFLKVLKRRGLLGE